MKKQIDIDYPWITSYPCYANLLAVLQKYEGEGGINRILSWFSYNYVLTECQRDNIFMPIKFYNEYNLNQLGHPKLVGLF